MPQSFLAHHKMVPEKKSSMRLLMCHLKYNIVSSITNDREIVSRSFLSQQNRPSFILRKRILQKKKKKKRKVKLRCAYVDSSQHVRLPGVPTTTFFGQLVGTVFSLPWSTLHRCSTISSFTSRFDKIEEHAGT